VWHTENRYAGVSDIPLDDLGRKQAARLAHWAREHRPDAVVCSPLRRCMDTAAPVAEAVGLPLQVDQALREVDFGKAEGHTLDELHASYPARTCEFLSDPVAHPFPGAENMTLAAERVLGRLREIVAGHRSESVLVIGHSTVLRLALCRWLGIPLSGYRHVFPRLDNAALTRLRVRADPTRPPGLLCLNASIDPAGDAATDTLPPAAAHPRHG
jgi:probable phosphoglycerate mutase